MGGIEGEGKEKEGKGERERAKGDRINYLRYI